MKQKARRERRVAFSGLVVSVLAILSAGDVSSAQTPTYRVERIDRPGATYYDLNNFGVISGSLNVNGVDQAHLFTHSSLFHHGVSPVSLVPSGFGKSTVAKSVNDMGDAAGTLIDDYGKQRATLFRNNTVTELEAPNSLYSVAWGINNHGNVIGYARNTQLTDKSLMWKNGQAILLPTLGGAGSMAQAINDLDMAVGSSYLQGGAGSWHAVLWQYGGATDLGTLGGNYSTGFDINNKGDVVGYSDTYSGSRKAVLWKDRLTQPLGGLQGAPYSEATDINDDGIIGGRCYPYNNTNYKSRAFIYCNGQMDDLTTVVGGNVVFTDVIDINNGGQILARGVENGQTGTYLLSPFQYNQPPQTQPDNVQVLEDSADNEIRVLDNDRDFENNPMMIFQVTQGQNGGVVKRTGLQTLTYTPPANYAGYDNFTYTALDSRGDTSTGTAFVLVAPVNDAPSFTPGTDVTVDENKTTTIPNWATNISAGPNNEKPHQSVQFEVVPQEPAAFFNIYVQGDGTLVVMPAWNYNGTTTVKVRAVDNGGTENGGINTSEYSTFSVTVQDVNNVPVAQDSEQTLNEDDSTLIFLNVSDADNDPVTSTIITAPKNGTLQKLWSETVYSYIPNVNFNGEDTFTFKVNDGKADSQTATVKLTVQPLDDPPTAEDLIAGKIFKTETKTITLSDVKAQDVDGDTLHFVLPALSTSKGTITPNESGTTLTYTPKANRSGQDSFAFKVTDGKNETQHNISINIENRAPNAQPDSGITVAPGEKTLVDVLANDSDPDGDTLKVTNASSEAAGLSFDYSNGQLYVTASASTPSDVVINYTIQDSDTDNTLTSSSTCSLTVQPANDHAPVANNDEYSFVKTTTSQTLTVLDNDSDADSSFNQLKISALDTTNLSGATASISDDKLSINFQSSGIGTFSFRYKITDNHPQPKESDWATVTVTYNNQKPVAQPQELETDEDVALPITLSASDADGDTLEYSIVGQPSHGKLSGDVPNRTYTPDENFHGEDSFTFNANDGTDDSNTATIKITVKPVNDAPKASHQNVEVNEDASVNISLSAQDVDGNTLEYSIVSGPAKGTLSGSGASRKYSPNTNYNGSDSFTFKANDGKTDSNIATVSITVKPQNDAPIANAGADKTVMMQGLTTAVTLDGSGSSDVDGDALTYVWKEGGNTIGTGINPTVNLTQGVHSITLTVTDTSNASSSDTVVVTVQMPSTTPGNTIKASGNITVTGGKVGASFEGASKKGKLSGSVNFSDSRNGGYNLRATSLQSVIVSGINGKIFATGIATIGRTSRVVTFVIEGNDLFNSKQNRGDTISLQVSDGYIFNGAYAKGDVKITTS